MPITQERMVALIEETELLRSRDALLRKSLRHVIDAHHQGLEGFQTAQDFLAHISVILDRMQEPALKAFWVESAHFKKVAKRNDALRAYQDAKRREAGVKQSYGPPPKNTKPQQTAIQTTPAQATPLPSWAPEMAIPQFPLVIGVEDLPTQNTLPAARSIPLPPGVEIEEDPATMAPDDVLLFLGLTDKGQK